MGAFTLEQVYDLFPEATERSYDPGQIVIYDGDRPSNVLFVKSGAYKFYDVDANGNEKILYLDGAGSIFPIFYTFEDKDHVDAFYATLSKSVFLLLPLDRFREVLSKNSDLSFQMLTWYAEQMDHSVMRLKSLEKTMAKQKILDSLLYLANQTSLLQPMIGGWYQVKFPLSQQTLADLAGLTRETVNAALKDIEPLGVMRTPCKLVVEIHPKKLAEVLTSPLS